MKTTILSFIVALALVIVLPMILFSGEGSVGSFFGTGSTDETTITNSKPYGELSNVTTDEKVEVYKWFDDDGVAQFSNKAPADGRESEIVVLQPNKNIMQPTMAKEESGEKPASRPNTVVLKNPYSVDGIKDMLHETDQAAETTRQQQEEQQKVLEQILKGMN